MDSGQFLDRSGPLEYLSQNRSAKGEDHRKGSREIRVDCWQRLVLNILLALSVATIIGTSSPPSREPRDEKEGNPRAREGNLEK